MSLRGGTRAKKERRPFTRLKKGLLAFAAACLIAAAILFLNYWNAFSQMARVWIGYYADEAAAVILPGADKAAPRCTALVEEAIQGGIPYDFTLGNAI